VILRYLLCLHWAHTVNLYLCIVERYHNTQCAVSKKKCTWFNMSLSCTLDRQSYMNHVEFPPDVTCRNDVMTYIICSENNIVQSLHICRNHGIIHMSLRHMTYGCTKLNLRELSVSYTAERLVFAILHRHLVCSHEPHTSIFSLYVSCTSLKRDDINRTK